MRNDGGPAFPRPHSEDGFNEVRYHGQDGMTLRDYFAAKAMQGFCANPEAWDASLEEVANWSYRQADDMLKARGEDA